MSTPDPLDRLGKLAALRDQGVIDAEEFSRLKAELLALVVDTGGSSALVGQSLSLPPPLDQEADFLTSQVDTICVTEGQVAESQRHLAALEQEVERLAKAHQERLARLTVVQRRVRHYAFLQTARRTSRDIAWGRFTPVMIATALGLLLGVIIIGILPLPTGLVLAGGVLTAGGVLLASLHVFAVPRDEAVAELFATKQQELAQLQPQIPQFEVDLNAAKTSFEEAKRQHLELMQKFESRLNQILLFDWRTLRGIPFEKFLGAVFEHLGYQVRHTGMSGDQGVDLIVEKDNVQIAVQAKGFAESVSNSAVQQVHAGMKYHKCHRCAVITNSCFTSSAIQLAASVGCTLVDGARIPTLILGQIRL